MKKIASKSQAIAFYFIISFVLAGCHFLQKDIRMENLSVTGQQHLAQLFSYSPTRCFSVYSFDLPADFKPRKEMEFVYKNHDVNIKTRQQYLPAFKQRIARREQELKHTQPINIINGAFLKNSYPLEANDNGDGIIFERMESRMMPDSARILEGYKWQDEVTLKIEIKARNGLAQRYDKDREDDPISYGNNVPDKLQEMHHLFQRIQPRDDLAIPTGRGICLGYSFMQDIDEAWKDIYFGYMHEHIDDFKFVISSDDYAEDYPLLRKPSRYFTEGRGKTIYKGKRESNGLMLEEWAVKGSYFEAKNKYGESIGYNDDIGYTFFVGIHMTDPAPKTPKLFMMMYYNPHKHVTPYTEKELMVIWKKITSSIRVRPEHFN
jgi:hypothetical protein